MIHALTTNTTKSNEHEGLTIARAVYGEFVNRTISTSWGGEDIELKTEIDSFMREKIDTN